LIIYFPCFDFLVLYAGAPWQMPAHRQRAVDVNHRLPVAQVLTGRDQAATNQVSEGRYGQRQDGGNQDEQGVVMDGLCLSAANREPTGMLSRSGVKALASWIANEVPCWKAGF
jgi:hypothetical protein